MPTTIVSRNEEDTNPQKGKLYVIADHGRVDWLGYWDEFVQKARFIKLACLCHIKQNNLTYLGRVCTSCLSVSTGIYDVIILAKKAWASGGEGKRGHLPPLAGQNSMFFDFFE